MVVTSLVHQHSRKMLQQRVRITHRRLPDLRSDVYFRVTGILSVTDSAHGWGTKIGQLCVEGLYRREWEWGVG